MLTCAAIFSDASQTVSHHLSSPAKASVQSCVNAVQTLTVALAQARRGLMNTPSYRNVLIGGAAIRNLNLLHCLKFFANLNLLSVF